MRFRVLGPLEVWTGEDWSSIGAPKWRALLAMLLLNPGQVVSTERLIAALWGDETPDRAANLVSVYVLRLRRLMGDPQGQLLATRAPGYQLRLEQDDLDAAVFEALVAQGRAALAGGDPKKATEVLGEALGLWRGGAMADVPASAPITAEADRLEEGRLTALELRITADLRCGEPAALVPEARRIISEHPLREGLWVLLLRALEAAGRRAEAIAAYSEARQVISDELGVDPGPELRQLYQQLLDADRAEAVRPAAPARAAAPSDGAPGGGNRPAALLARLAKPPAQLPADIADFTGRVTHVRQLLALVTGAAASVNPGAVTVAVVAGTPGLGKTTLAVHAAHAARSQFPDGQLYVTLRGAREQPVVPYEVLARLLRDLGTDPRHVPAGLEERAAFYRTVLTDRKVLVVLDGARDAAQVRPLLPGSASCAVIVTSRHRLADLAGSRLVDLDVLDEIEASELLISIIGQERAAAEPAAVREVLAACAGLPLAIRIAGARLASRRGWTVSALARRLTDQRRRVDEFTAGDLAVRTTFDVSYDFLRQSGPVAGVDPAHAFRLLGTWQGSTISLPAAAALLNEPEEPVADALEVLIDAHLLESPAPDRYAFHDLLRAYAAERARQEADAVAAATGRLLRWYLRAADAAAAVVAPRRERVPLDPAEEGEDIPEFATAADALDWAQDERSNLVAATRQASASRLHDIAWKLPVAAAACFDRHGYREEHLATHYVALDSVQALGDRRGEAWVLNNIGMVLGEQGDSGAIGYFERALALRREVGDRQGEAQTAVNIAFCYLTLGMPERAVTATMEALAVQRELGDTYGEGVALSNLGEAYLALGQHEEAVSWLRQALSAVRAARSPRVEGYVLQHLGHAHVELGQVTEGIRELDQALRAHTREGDRFGQGQDLLLLGIARSAAGQNDAARAAWQQALQLFEGIGDDRQSATVLEYLAGLRPPDAIP